jgi:hypothetical protein
MHSTIVLKIEIKSFIIEISNKGNNLYATLYI